MPQRVRLSELANMSPAEFREATAALLRASHHTRAHGSPSLERRIRAFEVRYEMSSEELYRRLAKGEQRETADICEWLLLLAAREERGTR